jgi:hypothetical protein
MNISAVKKENQMVDLLFGVVWHQVIYDQNF